jgi:hypothetical protein
MKDKQNHLTERKNDHPYKKVSVIKESIDYDFIESHTFKYDGEDCQIYKLKTTKETYEKYVNKDLKDHFELTKKMFGDTNNYKDYVNNVELNMAIIKDRLETDKKIDENVFGHFVILKDGKLKREIVIYIYDYVLSGSHSKHEINFCELKGSRLMFNCSFMYHGYVTMRPVRFLLDYDHAEATDQSNDDDIIEIDYK